MNFIDYILIVVIAAAVAFAVNKCISNYKKGRGFGGCCGDCSSCSGCGRTTPKK